MSVLLLDVWQDLREKRLVPVAIGLLVGLIAIPVLIMKPADKFQAPPVVEPSAGAAVTPGTASGQKALVSLATLSDPSKLEVFDSKNPFKPLQKVGSLSGSSDGLGGKTGSTAGTSGTGAVDKGADGVTPPETGGNKTTGSDTNPGGGGGGTTTSAYTYNVDVSFGQRGSEKDVKGLDRLEMLPDENDPLLVFLGVDSTVKYAVFLVDSSLTQSGEGLCKPDDETCSFLYLSLDDTGDEHNFTDDQGTEYTLKLLKINKVSVDSSSDGTSSSAQGSSADGSSTGFGSQVFTDLVTRH